jgi:hypothetical protein
LARLKCTDGALRGIHKAGELDPESSSRLKSFNRNSAWASGYRSSKGQSSFAQGTKRVPSAASRNRKGLYHIQLSAFWITHGLR